MQDHLSLNDNVKRHLHKLVTQVEPVINQVLSEMTSQELNHTLKQFEPYLKLDLKFYVQREAQSRSKTVEDFDTMFNQVTRDDQ